VVEEEAKTERLKATPMVEKLVRINSEQTSLSLDAGCGDGVYFSSFRSSDVVRLDLSLLRLRRCKQYPLDKKLHLVLGDVRFLPFRNGCFDFVLCSSVIEHMEEKDANGVFEEIHRIVDGIIEVEVPNRNRLFKLLTRILYGRELQFHKSDWTNKKLQLRGFHVIACLGWVSYYRFIPVKFQFLGRLVDLILGVFPSQFGGTLIGIKYAPRSLSCR
jgi:SAM-dependent methyltransferase